MNNFGSRLLAILAILTFALAKTADCIVKELNTTLEIMGELQSSIEDFRHCKSTCSPCKDIIPLLHIYHLNAELESQLDEVVEDVQNSCSFGTEDTLKLLVALSSAQQPISEILETFYDKHCDFENALGSILSHRVIGGALSRVRCLTLDLIRSVEAKVDPIYEGILSASSAQIDSEFQKVLKIY